jgi:hypothetical protein
MKRTLLAIATLAVVALVTPARASAITGNYVKDYQHPFEGLVAFYDADGNFMWRCSGSLLTDRVFLTAGHCTDQNAAESPVSARIWFEQNAGGAYDADTDTEDPNTGYPNRCLPGDDLCVTSTKLYDFGFDEFKGFPNIRDLGLIILPRSQAVELPEYGVLAGAGFLESLARPQNARFTLSGYGVTYSNPVKSVSYRERLMTVTRLVNLNTSHNTAGYNLQLSMAPGGGRGGSCFGDSGGPTFYGGFASNVIVGVTSWGFGSNRQTCGGTGFSFRTDTQAAISWILRTVRAHAPGELSEIRFVGG